MLKDGRDECREKLSEHIRMDTTAKSQYFANISQARGWALK
jgi:hypothetical protein